MNESINYPTRCQIIDADGIEIIPGVLGVNPEEAIPHIGKIGMAESTEKGIKITLDDGNILWGHQCWWIPLEEKINDD